MSLSNNFIIIQIFTWKISVEFIIFVMIYIVRMCVCVVVVLFSVSRPYVFFKPDETKSTRISMTRDEWTDT